MVEVGLRRRRSTRDRHHSLNESRHRTNPPERLCSLWRPVSQFDHSRIGRFASRRHFTVQARTAAYRFDGPLIERHHRLVNISDARATRAAPRRGRTFPRIFRKIMQRRFSPRRKNLRATVPFMLPRGGARLPLNFVEVSPAGSPISLAPRTTERARFFRWEPAGCSREPDDHVLSRGSARVPSHGIFVVHDD